MKKKLTTLLLIVMTVTTWAATNNYSKLMPTAVMPTSVAKTSSKLMASPANYTPMNLTPSNQFSIFGMDYVGHVVSINPGTGNWGSTNAGQVDSIWPYYQNYVRTGEHTNNQVSWFEITLSPYKDSATAQPHYLAFRVGVNGGINERIIVSMRSGSSMVSNVLCTKSGYEYIPAATGPTNFQNYIFLITNLTDITLRFEHRASSAVDNQNYFHDAGGVDWLAWEPLNPGNKHLRFDDAWLHKSGGGYASPLGNGYVISWGSGNGALYRSTNFYGTTVWVPIVTSRIKDDITGTRKIFYDTNPKGPSYFRLF